jgi:uncharacterized pyridoxal phosphate-containing UPF0001 family protein
MNPQNYQDIIKNISPFGAKLIVVSKYRSYDEIEIVRGWGQKIFAENRVQELVSKRDLHGNDISWHLIGTLQKNKVKAIILFLYCKRSTNKQRKIILSKIALFNVK